MNIPGDLSELLQAMADDFPTMLRGNLVGIYLWGSLTYDAFDETCSDVDCVCVTRRDPDDREFSELDDWFRNKREQNRWVSRIDMRFVIDNEFLDKRSRCCGFYHYTERLVRHGSDGTPIIWMNIASCGITLWGKDAKLISPHVSDQCLNDALLLELNYLKQDLASNAGNRSEKAFIHNAYAVLTACRILYSAHYRALASKTQASEWAMAQVRSAAIIARMQRDERFPPMLTAYVSSHADSLTRWTDSFCSERFAQYLATELLPWLADEFGVIPNQNILAGLSLTGLSAAHTALSYPAIFNRVLSLSGSFWWKDNWLPQEVRRRPPSGVAVRLTVGLDETKARVTHVNHGQELLQVASQIDSNRSMRDALTATGHQVSHLEHPGGHDVPSWRATLEESLIALLDLPAH